MANLKLDLLNKLRNDKYYKELKLVRLAQDPAMDYESKIAEMEGTLEQLVILNAQMELVDQYFNEPQAAPAPTQAAPAPEPVVEKPVAKVHQGQSHGEG